MAPQITLLPDPSDILGGITSGVGQITSGLGGGISSILNPNPTDSTSVSPSVTSSGSLSSAIPSSTVSLSVTSSSPSSVATPSLTVIGQQSTFTDVITRTANIASPSASPGRPGGFLQNKALSGFVFALVGLLAAVLIVLASTFAIRRQRRKKLLQEAISFEPASTRTYLDDMDHVNEKSRISGSDGHGSDGGYSFGQYSMPPPMPAAYQHPNVSRAHPDYGPATLYQTPYPKQTGQQSVYGANDDQAVAPSAPTSHRVPPPPVLPDAFGEAGQSSDELGPPVPLKVANA